MKLVIDIPDWYYKDIQEFKHPNFVDKALLDGIPFADTIKGIKESIQSLSTTYYGGGYQGLSHKEVFDAIDKYIGGN